MTVVHGVRSARERVIQTLWFEGVGLALVAPAFSLFADAALASSFALVALLSVVVMLWSACFNTAFDRIEWRCTGRAASDRPRRWRVAHALLLETTAVIVTCPVIVGMTGLDWLQALAADLALTLAYTAYAYAFHRVFDRLRPVVPVVEYSGARCSDVRSPRAAAFLRTRRRLESEQARRR